MVGTTAINNRLFRLMVGCGHRGWSVFGWGIAASSIAYTALLFLPKRGVYTAVWAVFLVGCAAAFPVSARLTDRAVRSARYQFLRLTDVPATEVVCGFVLIVLYRLRFAVGWILGAAPLFFLSAYLYVFQGAKQHCFAYISRQNWAKVVNESGFTRVFRLPEPARCVAPGDVRLAVSALANSPVPLALGCLLLLVIVLGVAWGLAHSRPSNRSRMWLSVAASLAVLSAAYARLLKPVLQAPVFCQLKCTYVLPWPPDPLIEIILLLVFPLAALVVMYLARRWV